MRSVVLAFCLVALSAVKPPACAQSLVRADGIRRLQRRQMREVTDAVWLNWLIAIAAWSGGAYIGASRCDGSKRVWCGIGGALVAGFVIAPLGEIWPRHQEEGWVTIRLR